MSTESRSDCTATNTVLTLRRLRSLDPPGNLACARFVNTEAVMCNASFEDYSFLIRVQRQNYHSTILQQEPIPSVVVSA